MNQEEQLIENQKRIVELSTSLSVWEQNAALTHEQRAKGKLARERLLFRLRELEIEGQKAKIAAMEEVLAVYKDEQSV